MPGPGTGPRPGGWETLVYDASKNLLLLVICNKWRRNEEIWHVNKAVIKAAVTLGGVFWHFKRTTSVEIGYSRFRNQAHQTYMCGYSRYDLIVWRTPHVSSSASPCNSFHNTFEWSVAEQVNEFTDMHWHTLQDASWNHTKYLNICFLKHQKNNIPLGISRLRMVVL